MTITWWLYYGGEPIASVRADEHASKQQVRELALDWHERVPLSFPVSPGEHANKLFYADIRR